MSKYSRTKKSIKFKRKSPIKTYKGRRNKFLKRQQEERAKLHKKYRTHNSSMRKSRYTRKKQSKSTRPKISFNLSKNTHYEYNKKSPPKSIKYVDKMVLT